MFRRTAKFTVVTLALLVGLVRTQPVVGAAPASRAAALVRAVEAEEAGESADESPAWVDANGDGVSDLGNILEAIDELNSVGVVFDDTDPQGHVPVRRKDGRYHMACVDLLLVTYRAAGYGFGGRAVRAKAADKRAAKKTDHGSGRFRQVAVLMEEVKRDPRFHFYEGPVVNPRVEKWVPPTRFRVGDMVFIEYEDNEDRHSGIVTGVDPKTGLPSYITQVSIYTDNEGIHRSTFNEFFSLKCRQLTGWARPAAWDEAPMPPEEGPLTVAAARRVLATPAAAARP